MVCLVCRKYRTGKNETHPFFQVATCNSSPLEVAQMYDREYIAGTHTQEIYRIKDNERARRPLGKKLLRD